MIRHAKGLVAILTLLGSLALGTALASGTPPTVSIDPPGGASFNSVHVSGTVNPEDHETYYCFETSSDAGSSWSGFCFQGPLVAGSGSTPVQADLGGLKPGTSYRVRLVANNSSDPEVISGEESFQTDPVDPPEAKNLQVSAVTAESAHFQGIVNSGGSGAGEKAGSYRFQCSPSCPGIEASHEFEAEGFADGADHTVQADASGLLPNEGYEVSLIAENAAATQSPSQPFHTAGIAPEAETNAVHGFVFDTTARFLGTVNPHHSQIQSCLFEYGTTTAYGQSVPCESYPEANEAGTEPYVAGAEAEGLQPQTTYHFRLVVDNGTGGPTAGPDRALTTQAPAPAGTCPNEEIRVEQEATRLPNCMAYELVSSRDQIAGFDGAAEWPDGNHFSYSYQIPGTTDVKTGNNDAILASRTPQGWQRRDLAIGGNDLGYLLLGLSGDGSTALVLKCRLLAIGCLSGPDSSYDVHFEGVSTESSIRSPLFPPMRTEHNLPAPQIAGMSTDASILYLSNSHSSAPLLAEDTHSLGAGLYQVIEGELSFVGYDENNQVLPCGAKLGNTLGDAGLEQRGVSPDGRTIAFESPDPEAAGSEPCPGPPDVYVRQDGHSVDISAPHNGNPDLGATFTGMTSNAKTVFFATASQLVAADGDEAMDLYSYDVAMGDLTLVSDVPGELRTLGFGGDVMPVTAVSQNGNYAYFVMRNPETSVHKLYVNHEGLITPLATASNGRGFRFGSSIAGYPSSPSQLSPDGRHLLFRGSIPLTGQSTGEEEQIFQYDAVANSFTCISCPIDSSPGNAQVPTFGGAENPLSSWRAQSDDGSAVVFNSTAALVPDDENGAFDAYLWRNGQLSLLGRSLDTRGSEAYGIDAAGRNVLISSTARLTQDGTDDIRKLYDVRVNGGFDFEAGPVPCDASSCRGPGTNPGQEGAAPGTASFSAPPGNANHRRKHQRRHKKVRQGHANHKRGGKK